MVSAMIDSRTRQHFKPLLSWSYGLEKEPDVNWKIAQMKGQVKLCPVPWRRGREHHQSFNGASGQGLWLGVLEEISAEI